MRFVDRAREAWRSFFVSGAERDAKAGRISRPLLTRRVLIVLSVVVGFTIPTATVIGAAAQRLHQAQSDATLHENGLRILASVGALDRQLRHLRADAVENHEIALADRAGVERALLRLEDAIGMDAAPAVIRRMRTVEADWNDVRDRRSFHEVDATVAAAGDLYGTVAQQAALSAVEDNATADAVSVLDDALPTIDDRVDEEQNILAGAIATRHIPISSSSRLAFQILASQESRAYNAASVSAQRVVDESNDRELLDAVRRLGFAYSQYAAATNYVLHLHAAHDTDRTLIDRRSGDVQRQIEAAEATASSVARIGYERVRLGEAATYDRTRAFALVAWLTGIIITAVGASALYRRELATRRKLMGTMVESLALSQAQLEAIFDRCPYGVAVLEPTGEIARENATLRAFLERAEIERHVCGDPRFAELFEGKVQRFTTEIRKIVDDRARSLHCEVSGVRLPGAKTIFALTFVTDVTDRREAESKLRYETNHDPISRLPNRVNFLERMRRAMDDEPGETGAVAFLEVDIEERNGTVGYTGDQIFAALSSRVASAIEPNDFVARFDGSAFVVLLYGSVDRASARERVAKILQRLAAPIEMGDREVHLRAAAGVALTDRSYETAIAVVRDAETAMFDARASGGSLAVFVPDMRDRAERRLVLSTHLRHALERDQLYVVFQPLIDAKSEELYGFEALLRWEHPLLGNIPPDEFIKLAEDVGAIGPIGRFVIDRALAELARWQTAGTFGEHACRMAINVSVGELISADYTSYVNRALTRHAVSPRDVTLEVTESAVLSGEGAAAQALERLRSIGVELAIDDFGTGYSSLRYLHDFHFQKLKIDGSFVRGAGDQPGLAARPIVEMLVKLARSLGVSIVAEGVETPRQAAELMELDVDYLQGYYYGRPMAASLVPEYVRSRRLREPA
jgi:diguanylate cyclase (GGDEF)-like protein